MQKLKSVPERYAPYALAAAALGIAAPAKASIITTYVNTTYTELDSPINFDIDGGGVNDYQLSLTATAGDSEIRWYSLGSNEVVTLTGDVYAGKAAGGQTIDSGIATWGTSSILRTKSTGGVAGYWPDNLADPRYIGLQFDIGPSTYYGWARVGVDTDTSGPHATATVYEYAYNNVAGASILSGQVSDAVPEPGTFSLFALGAAGIAAFKLRRRKA